MSREALSRFRTRKCCRPGSITCPFGVERCQYSHDMLWLRRPPTYISSRTRDTCLRYFPYPCPDLRGNNDLSITHSFCQQGGSCIFAHSAEEILYHPLFYKSFSCQTTNCKTYYCPFSHAAEEYVCQSDHFAFRMENGFVLAPYFSNVKYVVKTQSNELKVFMPNYNKGLHYWDVNAFVHHVQKNSGRGQTIGSSKKIKSHKSHIHSIETNTAEYCNFSPAAKLDNSNSMETDIILHKPTTSFFTHTNPWYTLGLRTLPDSQFVLDSIWQKSIVRGKTT